MMNITQSTTTLHNGVQMPWMGLGVFKVEEGSEVVNAVKTAIQHGYRSVDTAAIYANETGVGAGIRAGMQATGIKREDLFVTSKVWNADLGYESTLQAYETSLQKLGLAYSVAQFILRWDLQNGVVTIPKSIKEDRIVENASVFDFELTSEEMERIDALNQNHRVGPDPDHFDF